MSAVVVIVLWGVFIQGEDMTVRQITPECGETTCTITVEDLLLLIQAAALLLLRCGAAPSPSPHPASSSSPISEAGETVT
jgi:hypothetical protein